MTDNKQPDNASLLVWNEIPSLLQMSCSTYKSSSGSTTSSSTTHDPSSSAIMIDHVSSKAIKFTPSATSSSLSICMPIKPVFIPSKVPHGFAPLSLNHSIKMCAMSVVDVLSMLDRILRDMQCDLEYDIDQLFGCIDGVTYSNAHHCIAFMIRITPIAQRTQQFRIECLRKSGDHASFMHFLHYIQKHINPKHMNNHNNTPNIPNLLNMASTLINTSQELDDLCHDLQQNDQYLEELFRIFIETRINNNYITGKVLLEHPHLMNIVLHHNIYNHSNISIIRYAFIMVLYIVKSYQKVLVEQYGVKVMQMCATCLQNRSVLIQQYCIRTMHELSKDGALAYGSKQFGDWMKPLAMQIGALLDQTMMKRKKKCSNYAKANEDMVRHIQRELVLV